MLYIFNEVEMLDDDFPESMMPFLSEERRAKVQQLRYQNGKKESVAAYLLLRIALREVYNINEAVEFNHLEKGKPVLKHYPHIYFNLSHSRGVAACVVSDREVGVDVQSIRPVTDKAAKRILTEPEYTEFKTASNPDEYFCEIWAIKESQMKKTGQGIAAAFRKMPADEIKDKSVFKEKNYFCCVCGSFSQAMQVRYIRREDFEQLRD